MYTVTSKTRGIETISRFFETKRAAQTWVRFIKTLPVDEVALYHGKPGEDLISREAVDCSCQPAGYCIRHGGTI
jgi:hypothetical protein